jgi:hypothetical protein
MRPKLLRAFGYIIAETPYNENWVSAIKHVIPNEHREWNSKSKVWTIAVRYYEAVLGITEYFFGQVIDATGGVSESQAAWKSKFEDWCVHEGNAGSVNKLKKGRSPYDVLQVAENASPSVIKAVGRTLMHEYHPDKGGDPAKFREVKEALDKLKEMGRV